jgi:NADPH:quinone reductase-like Zn-dependent oxidoreductase
MNATLTTTETGTMKAVWIPAFGGPDVLSYGVTRRPEPREEELLIRVHAAGVNPVDWKLREGKLGPLPMPRVLGGDISGTVEALGPGVHDFYQGQPVFAYSTYGSGYSEFAIAAVSSVAPKPRSISDVDAAATPLAGLTAWQALFDIADLQAGQKVLILGGAGGVGTFAVQMAHRKGATVIATASASNSVFLRRLGANQVIDYHTTRFEDVVKQVDVVLDLVGGESHDHAWKVIKLGGTFVSTVQLPCQEQALTRGVRALKMHTRSKGDQLTLIGDLIANGELKVIVDKVLPLCEARKAQELSQLGHTRGKIVLSVDHDACLLAFC